MHSVLANFINMVFANHDSQICLICGDNGTELMNHACSHLFANHGIIHQRSMTYTPPAKWHCRKET